MYGKVIELELTSMSGEPIISKGKKTIIFG